MKNLRGNFSNPDNAKGLIYGYEIVCDVCKKQIGVGTCRPIEYRLIPMTGQLCRECIEEIC